MAKTRIETAVPELPRDKMLTANEAMTFVLAERDLQLAQLNEKQANTFLRAQELEAHLALTATKQQVEKAKNDTQQAQAKHKRISDHLAATYDFDWQNSCFDPLTGRIEPLPEQN